MIALVRHNSERTYPSFVAHNVKLLAPTEVHEFTGHPFTETLRRLLEAGIQWDDEWFVTLDADIYLTGVGAIADAVRRGFDYSDFHILDRFRGRQRGGPHVFSSRLLRAMFDGWEQYAHTKEFRKRPEGTAMRCGLRILQAEERVSPAVLGFHDYCQFRRDLFYKFVYRGWRTLKKDTVQWFRSWDTRSDDDFLTARRAIEWSWAHTLDRFPGGLRRSDVHEAFLSLDIAEKPPEITQREMEEMFDEGKIARPKPP